MKVETIYQDLHMTLADTWRRRRKPWSLLIDKERHRGWFGINLEVGSFRILWLYSSWGFGRPSFCLSVFAVSAFRALFDWDTAHISRLGELTGVPFLRSLHSLFWVSWTGYASGSSTEASYVN